MGSKTVDVEFITCDICGETAEGYDFYGDYICVKCASKALLLNDEEEDEDSDG